MKAFKKGNKMSKEDNLVSLSGAPIFRYSDGENEWESPKGEECIVEISDHIEHYIGQIDMVFHELISDTVHIDIHHVKPTIERPVHTLITSGMSDLKMKVPSEVGSTPFMELRVTLPASWEINETSFQNENWYWPIRQLKILARLPHKYNTWLAWGHTIPNGDPAESFSDNTKLSGVIILPPINAPSDFSSLEISKDKTIEFYSVVPLYNEEMNLKLNQGAEVLLDNFDKYKINDLISINRRNVAKKRFGLF